MVLRIRRIKTSFVKLFEDSLITKTKNDEYNKTLRNEGIKKFDDLINVYSKYDRAYWEYDPNYHEQKKKDIATKVVRAYFSALTETMQDIGRDVK